MINNLKNKENILKEFISIKETDRIKCCPFLDCEFRDKGLFKNNNFKINKLLCKNIHKSNLYRASQSKEFMQDYRCSKTKKRFSIKLEKLIK